MAGQHDNIHNSNYMKNITFCSYNVKNYDNVKYEAVKSIFPTCTFLLVQETWLAEKEFIRRFRNDFPNSECVSSNKMDLNGIDAGRRYGSVGICYHSNVNCKVDYIKTISKSICAQNIAFSDINLLLINVYMPSSDNKDKLEEYADILHEISSICITSGTQYIIVGGDWNADPIRQDGRTKLFRDFLSQENLHNALELDIANVPYTYFRPNGPGDLPSTSTIDHFILSPNLINSVIQYETVPLHNNFSDHIPLKMSLNIDVEFHKTHMREFNPSVAWYKCKEDNIKQYKNEMDTLLLQINPNHEAWGCRNFKCNKHIEFIQETHAKIVKILHEASGKTLPHTSQKKDIKIIPGWNEYVKEHSDRSKMWHDIWANSGRPTHGYLANIRRKTRLKYHYALRRVVRDNERMRNEKMGEAISENDDRILWDEVRKLTKTNKSLPKMMDGLTNSADITEIFSEKYKTLYNTVGYNIQELQRLTESINSRIDNGCTDNSESTCHNHMITVKDVKDAIDALKEGKKEENGLYSNHFKSGTDRLTIILTLFFNCMLVHGLAPDELLLGTMIPLIKDTRGKKQCSDNYRALTIGTGMAKILDIVILNQQKDKLITSNLQFGFKEKSSTTMCTFMALETIERYNNNGSEVHVLLLDASKAFDRVDYMKLFNKLLTRGMCPLTVRLLLNMYTRQKLQVKWNNHISCSFDVTNGVRQGVVLSPLLFSVYVDELLEKLKSKGIGCYMDHLFTGALGYADDIILMCPSITGMKEMIEICENYAMEHNILFNGKKSKYLVFGDYKYKPILKVNNEEVPRCDSAEHLGHVLDTKNTKNALIEHSIKAFNRSFYGFMSKFDSCNVTTRNKLFHQYCSSMYGSQLWDLTNNNIENMCKKWRKAHRRVLSVSNITHCDLLPLIADNIPLVCKLDCKYLGFYKSISTSDNNIINYTAKCKLYDHSSTLGKNMTHLIHKYDLEVEDMCSLSKNKIKEHSYNKWLSEINIHYITYAHIIKDMFRMKENRCVRFFSDIDCDAIIDLLCTI